jgi:GAF domain-containing protein
MGNDELNPESELRRRLLSRLIVGQTIAISALATMVTLGGLLLPGSGVLSVLPLGIIAAIVGLFSHALLRRGHLHASTYFFLLGTAAAITSLVTIRGYHDASAIYYLWPIVAAAILLDVRGGTGVAMICATLYVSVVVLQSSGSLTPLIPYDPQREGFLTVGSRLLMFFLLAFLGMLSSQNLRRLVQQVAQALQRLRELNETLEQRVAERTRDLERRTRYLEATATVAREATALLGDPQQLLTQVVNLISGQFGFYHTGIFLLDANGEWAVLQAASSEGGLGLVARGHRLRVGEEGIVGYVTGRGEPRIALDVGKEAVFFDNPDLPGTRSEMALPLRARGKIVGALDVQSLEPAAFSNEDVAVLQTLADQVAMAINSAQLFQQVQQSLEVERRAYSELSREAWRELVRTQSDLGFVRDEEGTRRVSGGEGESRGQDGVGLAMPIKVRGQVIGVIDAHKSAGERVSGGAEERGSRGAEERGWTAEQTTLLEALADQLGAALESARLYRDAQRLATRERLTREITDRMRRVTSVEGIVQTAVDELFNVLGVSRTFVRLGTTPPAPGSGEDARARNTHREKRAK